MKNNLSEEDVKFRLITPSVEKFGWTKESIRNKCVQKCKQSPYKKRISKNQTNVMERIFLESKFLPFDNRRRYH